MGTELQSSPVEPSGLLDGLVGLKAPQRDLLAAMDADIWDTPTRHSRVQLEHFVTSHREYPGHADKYHHDGLELLSRWGGIQQQIWAGRTMVLDIEAAVAAARWLRWFRWIPMARRAWLRRMALIDHLRAQLKTCRHDLQEYFRECGILMAMRMKARQDAEAANESLDFDRAEAARWRRRMAIDPELMRKISAEAPGLFVSFEKDVMMGVK